MMKLYLIFPMVSTVFGSTVFDSTITVREGDNFSLPCDMEHTFWSHNNRRILIVTGGVIFKSINVSLEVAENGTHLLIQNAKLEHAGVSKTKNCNCNSFVFSAFAFGICLFESFCM